MNQLGTFDEAKRKVLSDIKLCLTAIQKLSSRSYSTAEDGVSILDGLRKETYEDLNQIQHEHLIVCAAEWLVSERLCPDKTVWFWNPRQTGDSQEPDLRGVSGERIVVSAEITTSESPQGVIDTRMRKTLEKLSGMPGSKFYFVRTASMHRRACTKIAKANWSIRAIHLSA